MKPILQLCTAALLLFLNMAASAAVHYVDLTSPTPTPPYTTWQTAATTIQDAIDAATAGDQILVTNGVYATGGRAVVGTMTNRIIIDKTVTVRSVNGPDSTFIVGQGVGEGGADHGDGSIRCAFVGTNAILSGFTLTNGHTRTAGDINKEMNGGGAYCETNGLVTNCILTGNSAWLYGGGVVSGVINDCIITGNSAATGGGAYSATLNNCTFRDNSASGYAGGASSCTLKNCTLMGNTAGRWAGAAEHCTMNNCTIIGNSSLIAGGVFQSSLKNCILYFNIAPENQNHSWSTFAYCCTTPLPEGAGNIDADPLLASATHISSLSPCARSGNTAYASGVDIDGETWLNPPSMGADQFVAGAVTGELIPVISGFYTNIQIGFPVTFIASITGRVSVSSWDFGDGVVVSNRACSTHSWSVPGLYEVRLTAYNDSFPYGVITALFVQVAEQQVYYVNASNPAPVFPYTNWAGAARNIQDAIDAGTQLGRIVRVTNGVYTSGGRAVCGEMTNRVVVPEKLELRSENGPLVTIITGHAVPPNTNGNGAVRCVFVGSNAVVSGFTLTNGHTRMAGVDWEKQQSGGGAWCEMGGALTNCILIGNSGRTGSGGVHAGRLDDCSLTFNAGGFGGGANLSTLNNCILASNSAVFGGGAYGGALNNCVLTGNSAPPGNGGGTVSAILNNCTLTRNWALKEGGGSCWGTLNNCTLVGNSAAIGGGASSATLNNCIAFYNNSTNGPNYFSCSFTNSCTTPLPEGPGNIDSSPLFINTNDWVGLHLRFGSPCINAGNDTFAFGSTDLDGNPRIVFDTVDMGAYEFDGAAHYVNSGNPTPITPYRSWETAATNIQDAIDVASPGDTIYVYKGVYGTGGRAFYGSLTNRIAIDRAITVQSVSGPSQTIIIGQGVGDLGTNNGDGAIRCAYVGTGAVLSGFTLTNGHTSITGDALKEQSGGGAWCETRGVLINCILTGNTAKGRGGAVYSGLLTNCIMTGNSAPSGGGAASAILVNCLITANAANTYGGGIYYGSLYNCTVAGNTSGTFGGGVFGATLTNSIVYYNAASINPNANGSTFAWSCTTPMPSGPGNTTNAPLFQNTNGWSNLRLQFNSPCIDTGNTTFSDTDLDGHPRIFGAAVDKGAYEHQGAAMGEYMVWLERYNLPTDGSANEIDSDLDGLNNYQEWRSGTNPTNAASVLRLTQLSTNTLTLQWHSVSGIRYLLQRSTNLSATPPFLPLATNLLGTSNPMTYTDTNPPPLIPLFYRLGVGD